MYTNIPNQSDALRTNCLYGGLPPQMGAAAIGRLVLACSMQNRYARAFGMVALACLALNFAGCAAFTNPVANGVPVYMIPDELLAPTKEGLEPIDLTLLRQAPPEEYLLSTGDTLGVYVQGVLGNAEEPPPVSVPDTAEVPPSIGYPFPIRADGTISLPYLGALEVSGLTIEGAEQKVIDAYLEKQIVKATDYRIIVTLLRPRYERVLVVREDAGQSQVSVSNTGLVGFDTQTTISGGRSATGQAVDLPAYENDVLNALTRTGGMPGPDAIQEVLIFRGGRGADNRAGMATEAMEVDSSGNPYMQQAGAGGGGEIIRIPLEVSPGMPPRIGRDDIILKTGDIVTVRAREPELYYTGGLIPSGEFQLPFDRDITVIEALLKSRAPLISGGLSTSNLSGSIVGGGVGNPSPSLVSIIRKAPGGTQLVIKVDINEALRDPRQNIRIQAEDVLVLQENPDEAFTRYLNNAVQFDLFFRFLDRGDATGSGAVSVP